ncbi:hypothetical protein M5689_018944 [Euphorbia peplus]|nr:hypothetical protein M5689_018944 [Euphorbia peplus]
MARRNLPIPPPQPYLSDDNNNYPTTTSNDALISAASSTIQSPLSSSASPTDPLFQILRSPCIPQSMMDFLRNQNEDLVFVDVGIENDVKKLGKDYGLRVGYAVDLRGLVAEMSGDGGYRHVRLKELTRRIMEGRRLRNRRLLL